MNIQQSILAILRYFGHNGINNNENQEFLIYDLFNLWLQTLNY